MRLILISLILTPIFSISSKVISSPKNPFNCFSTYYIPHCHSNFTLVEVKRDIYPDYPANSLIHYGPIKILLSQIHSFNYTHIVPALNPSKQKIYVAINCTSNMLNVSAINNRWKKWSPPVEKFEINLLNDICYSFHNDYKPIHSP